MSPGSVRTFRDHLFALMTTGPDAATRARAPSLDRCCVIRSRGHCLRIGGVNGHPLLRENARATTSPLIRIAAADGWARTWSRIYRLLAPDPRFIREVQRDARLAPGAGVVWERMPASSRH